MKSPTLLGLFLAGAATVLLGFVTFCAPVFNKLWLYSVNAPGRYDYHFGTLGHNVNGQASPMRVGYRYSTSRD